MVLGEDHEGQLRAEVVFVAVFYLTVTVDKGKDLLKENCSRLIVAGYLQNQSFHFGV